ncbi:MAG: 3-dehydroquinate synthase [Kiritimatiellia bacterium]
MSHIFLYGPPGSGKSTIGKILADRLQMTFRDIDDVIEDTAGCRIAEIFERHGEKFFRDMETTAIIKTTEGESKVIALGGGALLRDKNRKHAEKTGSVLCFTADKETLLGRIRRAPGQRPLANEDKNTPVTNSPLLKLLEKRAEHYNSFRLRLRVSDIHPEETASNAQKALGRFRVSGMGKSYPVFCGSGLINSAGMLLKEQQPGRNCVIVSDSNTAPLYAQKVAESLEKEGITASNATIRAGEEYKTVETVICLWKKFMEAGIERNDTIIALGGGVTGDLTGFAASTWLRGVRWVSMPTTLLSMCDSGIGGKTGADLPEGKNLIGTFHPPALVIADTDTLSTLPVREIRCGLAETIKHAIIGDPGILKKLHKFGFCRNMKDSSPCTALKQADWLAEFVAGSMAVKISIVTADPFEKGIRASLNLGHTIGHGIEKATGFSMQHGEAVAVGIVMEAEIAAEMQLADRQLPSQIRELFDAAGLPTSPPDDINSDQVIKAIALDKKKAGGRIRFALPVEIGKVQTGIVVADELLRKIISR